MNLSCSPTKIGFGRNRGPSFPQRSNEVVTLQHQPSVRATSGIERVFRDRAVRYIPLAINPENALLTEILKKIA